MAKVTEATEFRELTDVQLIEKLKESKEELFNLRFQLATGQLTANNNLSRVRKTISRIYTVLRERELGLSNSPESDK